MPSDLSLGILYNEKFKLVNKQVYKRNRYEQHNRI